MIDKIISSLLIVFSGARSSGKPLTSKIDDTLDGSDLAF
ncbi:hypothetical protein D1BOALGB6SA_896 [Olavius sp. associated proteobacterium Delta 1]|nr:hypothetical protein D1BOALGB6SA_896 [Olavius sp. associated proteobacterium Delta 1]